jgi:hypothetical protein
VSGHTTQWNRFTGYVVIDEESNKGIMRGPGITFGDRFSSEGKYLFVTNSPDSWRYSWRCECWNVPPRKAMGVFLYGATAWLLGCLLLRSVFHLLSLRRRKAPGIAIPAPGG